LIAEKEFSKNSKNVVIETEVVVATPNGKKKFRVADLAVYRLLNNLLEYLKIVQVGKSDKNGKPVKREQEAIDDIEAHTNLKVTFVDYQSKKIKP